MSLKFVIILAAFILSFFVWVDAKADEPTFKIIATTIIPFLAGVCVGAFRR